MSHVALTARYRPQTFAQVAGQETVKAILSRAALEGKVAPAYLLSGTRGVGKTTIARIFAKALNCAHGPTGEPCNECEQCRQITQGVHVDVVEIDGASNRGIDDARRLKEAIGYAPMEGRYKVFIIDEAHMLTKEAFNALLKTLEEPPARVTFILATTESHKFPITIVSRCQHFTFTRLAESELEAHLSNILTLEAVPFDAAAVKLIAKRAAGSVRDSMSLLGQVLALGEDSLTTDAVRGVLGLAGQDAFFSLMEALATQDCLAVATIVRDLLDKGVDIGFFLRELVSTWRTLFMLRQSGEAALTLLDFSEEEGAVWLAWARRFDTSLVHACWQMTLEGQRRVLTSLEPAMALELLLLNIAMLPRLMPLEKLQAVGQAVPASAVQGATPKSVAMPERVVPVAMSSAPSAQCNTTPSQNLQPSGQAVKKKAITSQGVQDAAVYEKPPVPWDIVEPASITPPPCTKQQAESVKVNAPAASAPVPTILAARPVIESYPPSLSQDTQSWEGFIKLCLEDKEQTKNFSVHLRHTQGQFAPSEFGGTLTIFTTASIQYDRLSDAATVQYLAAVAKNYYGVVTRIEVLEPERKMLTEAENRAIMEVHPAIELLKEELGARFVKCRPPDSLT